MEELAYWRMWLHRKTQKDKVHDLVYIQVDPMRISGIVRIPLHAIYNIKMRIDMSNSSLRKSGRGKATMKQNQIKTSPTPLSPRFLWTQPLPWRRWHLNLKWTPRPPEQLWMMTWASSSTPGHWNTFKQKVRKSGEVHKDSHTPQEERV